MWPMKERSFGSLSQATNIVFVVASSRRGAMAIGEWPDSGAAMTMQWRHAIQPGHGWSVGVPVVVVVGGVGGGAVAGGDRR